jgi:hypothetical protein
MSTAADVATYGPTDEHLAFRDVIRVPRVVFVRAMR